MSDVGEELLYVACGLLKEIEIEDDNEDDLCTVLPLDEEDGCVGVLKVFVSKEAALRYANDVVEIPSESIGEKKSEMRGEMSRRRIEVNCSGKPVMTDVVIDDESEAVLFLDGLSDFQLYRMIVALMDDCCFLCLSTEEVLNEWELRVVSRSQWEDVIKRQMTHLGTCISPRPKLSSYFGGRTVGLMITDEAKRSAKEDRNRQRCECIDGHVWYESFYRDAVDRCWCYADSAGSFCPYCGEQDMLDHGKGKVTGD